MRLRPLFDAIPSIDFPISFGWRRRMSQSLRVLDRSAKTTVSKFSIARLNDRGGEHQCPGPDLVHISVAEFPRNSGR
jgi:hypothetical protein